MTRQLIQLASMFTLVVSITGNSDKISGVRDGWGIASRGLIINKDAKSEIISKDAKFKMIDHGSKIAKDPIHASKEGNSWRGDKFIS